MPQQSFEPDNWKYGPNKQGRYAHPAPTERRVQRERAMNMAIRFLIEQEKMPGRAWPEHWKTLARNYVERRLLGRRNRLALPDEVMARVQEALRFACEQTGFVLPQLQEKKRRKKK